MKKTSPITTKTLACCAMLTALSVVLARLFGLMPEQSSRYSIESAPIFLAGILFGPLAGGMVGFCADFVGCLFSAYGYNPIFCIPPILYGVCGGLFRFYLNKKLTLPRLAASLLPPVVAGSILYQSIALAYVYYRATFWEGLALKLSTRSIQFAIVLVADALVLWLLFQANIFRRLGLWPLTTEKKGEHPHDC